MVSPKRIEFRKIVSYRLITIFQYYQLWVILALLISKVCIFLYIRFPSNKFLKLNFKPLHTTFYDLKLGCLNFSDGTNCVPCSTILYDFRPLNGLISYFFECFSPQTNTDISLFLSMLFAFSGISKRNKQIQ